MQPTAIVKSWSHHVHDTMLAMGHHISQHLHSRHFWAGVGITLLVVGIIALFVYLAQNTPMLIDGANPYGYPYTPYR